MVNKNKIKKDDKNIIKTIDEDEKNFPEEISLEDTEIHLEDKIKKLKQKNSAYETEVRFLKEELARAKADYLNARRRQEADLELDKERSAARYIETLIPLYDSFYMATLDKATWEKADAKWRQGIEAIFDQLKNILTKYNVTVINPANENFDPLQHEALRSIATTDQKKHQQIFEVIQVGFIINSDKNEKVIRPARVTVGEYTK